MSRTREMLWIYGKPFLPLELTSKVEFSVLQDPYGLAYKVRVWRRGSSDLLMQVDLTPAQPEAPPEKVAELCLIL